MIRAGDIKLRPGRTRTAVLAAIAVIILGLTLTKTGSPPERPNIVVIFADALRPDHMGAYGYRKNGGGTSRSTGHPASFYPA